MGQLVPLALPEHRQGQLNFTLATSHFGQTGKAAALGSFLPIP